MKAQDSAPLGCLVLVIGIGFCIVVGWWAITPSEEQRNLQAAIEAEQAKVISTGKTSGTSPTCGPIVGKTAADFKNVEKFCSRGIAKGTVAGASAMESILSVKVTRLMAEGFRADRLSGEQLVHTWMNGWKQITGSRVVTINVEWGDVKIAVGQTTVISGDMVTIQ